MRLVEDSELPAVDLCFTFHRAQPSKYLFAAKVSFTSEAYALLDFLSLDDSKRGRTLYCIYAAIASAPSSISSSGIFSVPISLVLHTVNIPAFKLEAGPLVRVFL